MTPPTPAQRIKRVRRYLRARTKAYGQPPEHIAGIAFQDKPERKLLTSDVQFLLQSEANLRAENEGLRRRGADLTSARADARQEAHNERTLKLQAREELTAANRELAELRVRNANQADIIARQAERNEWICNQLDQALPDDDSTMQEKIKRLCSIQKERAAATEGITEINRARAYQLTHHPQPPMNSETRASRQRELLLAALSLLLSAPAIYPFGSDSYRGVCRTHRNRLAHAGACIAALIDLLPPRREYWNGQPIPEDAEDQ